MELQQLPIIDWELGTKLAGGKKELAKELLDMFVSSLSEEISAFKHLYNEKNYAELSRKVHKLHGAIAYLGLPRLKILIARLESDLKHNIMGNLLSHLNQLDAEINFLLEHFSSFTWDKA